MISLINGTYSSQIQKNRKSNEQFTGAGRGDKKESCEFHVCKMKSFRKSASQQYQYT